MTVIVTGGRDFDEKQVVYDVLDYWKPDLIVEGGARGADRLARQWAIDRKVNYKTVEADWSKFGKQAGHLRNRKMLEEYPDAMVIAFPGGKGTANCVAQAEARKRIVVKASKC